MVEVKVTDFGQALLIKALSNESPINFVSMKFGNGTEPDDYTALTDLVNPLLECSIARMEKGDNYIQLVSVFDNSNVDTDFALTEIGVFAEDSELGKGMYAYVNQADESEPVYGPQSSKLKETTVAVQIIVDDTENVTATIKSLSYATKADLDDHIHDYQNPHKVTAEQVGLGNVENVKTGDAQIDFKAAAEAKNIESGETVSTVFGKLYTALKALLAHLTDYNNPHKVTPFGINAAAVGHQHSASDINAGTLSVTRGGTGKGAWTKSLLLFASATNQIGQVARPSKKSVLVQDGSGDPHFEALSSIEFVGMSDQAPEDHNVLWIDPTPVTGGLKYYKNNAWVHVPVAYAADSGGNT